MNTDAVPSLLEREVAAEESVSYRSTQNEAGGRPRGITIQRFHNYRQKLRVMSGLTHRWPALGENEP
jgi:hypothetical protein